MKFYFVRFNISYCTAQLVNQLQLLSQIIFNVWFGFTISEHCLAVIFILLEDSFITYSEIFSVNFMTNAGNCAKCLYTKKAKKKYFQTKIKLYWKALSTIKQFN